MGAVADSHSATAPCYSLIQSKSVNLYSIANYSFSRARVLVVRSQTSAGPKY